MMCYSATKRLQELKQCIDAYQKLLLLFEAERNGFLSIIATGYATWVHYDEAETKRTRKEWRHPSLPRPTQFLTQKSAWKVVVAVRTSRRFECWLLSPMWRQIVWAPRAICRTEAWCLDFPHDPVQEYHFHGTVLQCFLSPLQASEPAGSTILELELNIWWKA